MRIDCALVGHGYWGRILRRYLEGSDTFTLKYVCFPSARPEGIFVNNLDRIWEDPSVKVVIVATPIGSHFEIVKKAILAEKSVMCEKPLVVSREQAVTLKDMAQSQKVKVITDFTYTFSPSVKKIKEILQQETIGEISYIEMRMLQFGHFSGDNVYNVEASHFLSILYEWSLIDGMDFEFNSLVRRNDITETGEVCLQRGSLHGRMIVSLNSPTRERAIKLFGSKGFVSFDPLRSPPLQLFLFEDYDHESRKWRRIGQYEFDEGNNLANALDYLHGTLIGLEEGNLDMAIQVASILEQAAALENVATKGPK